jgi:hypothetical protein
MKALMPRLPGPACEAIVRHLFENGPERWHGFDPANLPASVRYAATGGAPVGSAQLATLRADVVAIARRHGFGRDTGRSSLALFDAETAAWLAQADIFSTGEALRDDVWSFVAAVVAPDIVHWRFGAALERYTGGVRNTYQRLWMRGRALDRGSGHPERWKLLDELTEDALVQITERPSIGGDPILSVAVAEAWLRASRFHGKSAMEDIMRRAALRIRIRNEIRALSELAATDLEKFLDATFGVTVPVVQAECRKSGDETNSGVSLRDVKADHARTDHLEDALSKSDLSLREAIDHVLSEADRCGWLSPKSRAALNELYSGRMEIARSERNALDYLLGRLSAARLLGAEMPLIRSAMREDPVPSSSDRTEPERPRKRSWAIWRAR